MSQGLEASESLAQGTQRERRSRQELKVQERRQAGKEGRGSRGRGADASWVPTWVSLTGTVTRRFPAGTGPQTPR